MMESLESIKIDGSWKQVLHLLHVNQKILELFIEQAINLSNSSDAQVSLHFKEENGVTSDFLQKLESLLSNLESQATGDLSEESTNEFGNSIDSCRELLTTNVSKLDSFHKSLSSIIYECKKPSYLHSNWLSYGSAAVLLFGTI